MNERPVIGPTPDRTRWLWTRQQRQALCAIVLVAAMAIAHQLAIRKTTLSDPLPASPPLAWELADRIDPNLAPIEHLSALPGIGPAKGAAIVNYRTPIAARGEIAFRSGDDLMKVRGIGQITVEQLLPYLQFSADMQSTAR